MEHCNRLTGTDIDENRYLNLLEKRRLLYGFIPVGLNYDLIDTAPLPGGTEHPSVINDVFGGFSNSDIFDQMNANILSPSDLKSPLNDVAPSGVTRNQIDLLI